MVGEMFTVDIVTMEWLKECVVAGSHVKEEQFRAPLSVTTKE